MSHFATQTTRLDDWLDAVASRIERDAPDLKDTFDVYAAEARFGRNFIADDLSRLRGSARIIEVGAGAYLLSCQLVREGFRVTSIEPVGEGFSHFHRMQAIVAELAAEMGCMPNVAATEAEKFSGNGDYDFAFSINVMEHVRDVKGVIQAVMNSLHHRGWYHFTCANYAFPYEPHFNMPTLISKRMTEFFMRKRIFNYPRLADPRGTWNSLNWISVRQVVKIAQDSPGLSAQFDRQILTNALERVVSDPQFAARRSGWVRSCIGLLVRTGMHRLPSALPSSILPIIDCRIEKRA